MIWWRCSSACFTTVKHAKPPASRKESSEWYVIAQGFKGTGGLTARLPSLLPHAGEGWMRVFCWLEHSAGFGKGNSKTLTLPSPPCGRGFAKCQR